VVGGASRVAVVFRVAPQRVDAVGIGASGAHGIYYYRGGEWADWSMADGGSVQVLYRAEEPCT
jgi:hypothetical protein